MSPSTSFRLLLMRNATVVGDLNSELDVHDPAGQSSNVVWLYTSGWLDRTAYS